MLTKNVRVRANIESMSLFQNILPRGFLQYLEDCRPFCVTSETSGIIALLGIPGYLALHTWFLSCRLYVLENNSFPFIYTLKCLSISLMYCSCSPNIFYSNISQILVLIYAITPHHQCDVIASPSHHVGFLNLIMLFRRLDQYLW